MVLKITPEEHARLQKSIVIGERRSEANRGKRIGGRKKSTKHRTKIPAKAPAKNLFRRDIVHEDGKYIGTYVRCQIDNGRGYVQSGFTIRNRTLSVSFPIGEVLA